MLVCVDDILCIQKDPNSITKALNKYFPLKSDSAGTPKIYLVAKLKLMQPEKGVWEWVIGPSKYVRKAVKNSKNYISKHLSLQYRVTKLAPNLFPNKCEPGTDISPDLNTNLASYFQYL